MKITHIMEDFSKLSGGLRTVVEDINYKLMDNQIIVKLSQLALKK